MTHAHVSAHLIVDGHLDGLECHHGDGRVSIRIAESVWIAGSPEQMHDFATELHRYANRAARLVRSPSPDVLDEPVVLPKVDAA